MTTPPTSNRDEGNPSSNPVVLDDFEVAHTAITRAIRAINNEERGGDGAEFVTHVLATVAANLGSSYAVIQARSGSWEADVVGRMLSSTVGCDDEFLMTYRTEPVEIIASSTYELDELSIYETYEASLAHIRQTLFGDRWTPARDQLTDDELEQIEDVEIALIDLEDSDAAEYEQRFAATVAARWEQLRTEDPLGYPTELSVTVHFVTASDTRGRTDGWGSDLASRLYQHARENTLLPGSDTLPDWSPGFVDTLLVDGHWPHLRIPELAHYSVPAATSKEN
ncbi:hypothetical protein GCM10009554_46470 [Kribbella koreensis]|uniref:Uncharacterized protein n=1 Tax=Kribbella koreensis TaxID=57909 RepID=A0ABP4BIN5_9ACTN